MTEEVDRIFYQLRALERRQRRRMAIVILAFEVPLALAVLYGLLKLAGWMPW